MLLATNRETTIDLPIRLKIIYDVFPELTTLHRSHERLRVAYHDQSIAGSREHDIDPLRGAQKSNVVSLVTSCERYDDNIALISLEVV